MQENQFSSGGVVIRGTGETLEVLLIKDSYGHWTWAKGHLEKGETEEETALREISEETGLKTLKIIDSLGKQEYWFSLGEKKIFKTVTVFLVKAGSGEEIKIQVEEVQEAAWFAPQESIEKIEYEGSRTLLEKGINTYKEKKI
jgi:8-oxo-dGTP pyrophosphatase MutT (NUDIX family)